MKKERRKQKLSSLFLERVTRLELAPLPQKAFGFPGIPTSYLKTVEAASSKVSPIKQEDRLSPIFFLGAGYEARTRYLHLGKVALYQMS